MFAVLVTFAFALVATMVVGIPIATRLAQVHVWKRTALPEMPSERENYQPVRFEPVDFGPDPIQWPSEVSRESHGIPEPPWPSSTWTDEHFGKQARALHAANEAREDREDARRDAVQAKRQLAVEQRQQQAEENRGPQRTRERREEQPIQSRKAPPRRKKRKQPTPEPRATAPVEPGMPDPNQVERLVAELGLAGTVQHLMKTQGWDFKTAAAWLGRVRKG